jgi:hypothetical protein
MKEFKTIKIILAVAAIVALFVSCSEDTPDGGESEKLQYGSLLVISAGSDTNVDDPTTRARVDPDRTQTPVKYTYYWQAGDKIKLTVTNVGSKEALKSLDKLELISTLPAETEATTSNFAINSQPEMYAELLSAEKFDFYAYFPNGWTSVQRAPTGGEIDDRDFPNSLSFRLKDKYEGQHPNIFEAGRTPMVDSELNHKPTILYDRANTSALEGEGSDAIKFRFNHITSYLSLEMDFSELPKPESYTVDNIVMTVGSGNTEANRINGTYTYNIADGTYTLSSDGTNRIEYTGMVGMGDNDRLSIPIPPKKIKGFKFQCTFHGADEKGKMITVESADTEITFVRGMIHHISITPKTILSIGSSELLYFDLTDSQFPLKLGSWLIENDNEYYGPNDEYETETLTEADRPNLAFFKFGSVVGFTSTGTWNNSNIKFNPTRSNYNGYGNIPYYSESDDYNNGNRNISATIYHYGTNVFNNGKGDPCQLAGIDMTHLNSLRNNDEKIAYIDSYDNGWRMPSNKENLEFVGYDPTITGETVLNTDQEYGGVVYYRSSPSTVWSGSNLGTGIFPANPVGDSDNPPKLPAAGFVNNNGNAYTNTKGTQGNFWASEAGLNKGGSPRASNMGFTQDNVTLSNFSAGYAYGMSVRCVRK